MPVLRAVPNVSTADVAASMAFYAEYLGLDIVMAMDWIVTFASSEQPAAQISVITADMTAPVVADISVEVANVDRLYALAIVKGFEIVYPLTTEPWGVRRFFVLDPNGKVINIVSHLEQK